MRLRDLENAPAKSPPPRPASWSSLPHKGQLAIITSVRIVDFFQVASLQAFMYHQLQSFAPDAPDSTVSFQTGVLQGVFTSAQIFTGVIWGRVADAPWAGRKMVLLIGLVGTGLSCIGLAFSRSFAAAVTWRCLGGAINGTVGAARTTLAETVEKKYHSRAFLLLPLAFNIANIFGPVLGGLLADPVAAYPAMFGPGSPLGGKDGVAWLIKFPYAMPNLLSATLLFLDAAIIWLGLHETQQGSRLAPDRGLAMGESFMYWFRRLVFKRRGYAQVSQQDAPESSSSETLVESVPMTPMSPTHPKKDNLSSLPSPQPADGRDHRLPFRKLLTTSNVLLVLLTVAIFDFQMGGFASLWLVFLSSSRRNPVTQSVHLPFHFTGGLEFAPSTLGFAMAILGILGILLQIVLYPRINARFGLVNSTRFSLLVFPVAYFLAPYLSLIVSSSSGSGFLLWAGITLVILLQVGARTFAMPGTILLINNSAPHPSLLGTVHGLGSSVSSAFRTIGPIVTGYWYARGLEFDMVGYSWWALATVSVVGCVTSFWAQDGS